MRHMKGMVSFAMAAAFFFVTAAENLRAEDKKALEIREAALAGGLEVDFNAVKPVFRVGESVRFKVKGNKDFYLYLFNVAPDQNIGYMLLPNVKQQYILYRAGKEYMVPEKYIEFFSDRPGSERVIMVASTEKMDLDTGKYKKSGDFFQSDAKEMEQAAKALMIRSAKPKTERVTKELNLIIVGGGSSSGGAVPVPIPGRTSETPPPRTGSADVISAFVSTDRLTYNAGESIVITYGADKKGFVHLLVVEPNGKKTLLKTSPVDGKSFYQAKAVAAPPGGRHKIVAVYDASRDRKKGFDDLGPDTDSFGKGVRLAGSTEVYAVYSIYVRE